MKSYSNPQLRGKKNFTIISALFIITCFILITLFNSCKKIDNNTITKDDQSAIERVRNNVKSQMEKEGGIPEIVTINQRMHLTFVDMQGNPAVVPMSNRISSTCGGDLPDYCDLKQYVRIYQCASSTFGVGYKIQCEYKLSWNNTVVKVNPNNSSNKTKCRVKIVNGSTTYFDKTTYDVQITDLGADPNPLLTGYEIFRVRFTFNDLAPDFLINNSGYTLRLGPTFATDCSTLENYAVALADPAGYGISPGLGTDPCNRNEKAWYQPPGIIASNRIGVTGYNVRGYSCGYGSTFIQLDLQEVQYSKDSGSTWTDFDNYYNISGIGIAHTKYIRAYDIAQSAAITPAGTYNIAIRYRNWKYTSSSYQWQVPTSSNSASNCPTDDWAYEYYPSTVIP